jgi:hypothetical protein
MVHRSCFFHSRKPSNTATGSLLLVPGAPAPTAVMVLFFRAAACAPRRWAGAYSCEQHNHVRRDGANRIAPKSRAPLRNNQMVLSEEAGEATGSIGGAIIGTRPFAISLLATPLLQANVCPCLTPNPASKR